MVSWADDVDEILASDLAAGFAYLTPAKGVVITPMAPSGCATARPAPSP